MLDFIKENIGTLITSLIIIIIVSLISINLIKKKKKGKCISCDCANCPSACHEISKCVEVKNCNIKK